LGFLHSDMYYLRAGITSVRVITGVAIGVVNEETECGHDAVSTGRREVQALYLLGHGGERKKPVPHPRI